MLPIMVAGSLELVVLDPQVLVFLRAFALVKLVKLWAGLRSDDVQGILPKAMGLDRKGLTGTINRTKTTGPGKRVRWLPFSVDKGAFFLVEGWLEAGWSLFRGAPF